MYSVSKHLFIFILVRNYYSSMDVLGTPLYKGDNCGAGVCVSVQDCPSALESVRRTRTHNLERCGFEGFDEIVCCPDSDSAHSRLASTAQDDSSTPTTVKSNGKPSNKLPSVRKSVAACEQLSNEIRPQLAPQILGGEDAQKGEFPHMAALGYPSETSDEMQFGCGGSLINDRYVLTAAHCIVTTDGIEPTMVRLGKIDLTGNTDNLPAGDYKIDENKVHPEYRRKTKENDIALIRLKKRVKYTDFVHPACLFTEPDNPKEVIVTGWGVTQYNGNQSKILQKVTLVSVPTSQCNQTFYTKFRRNIYPKQICAISSDGTVKDACKGDSGGPLQIEYIEGSSVYSIVGITSFGENCGGKSPGVYTRVSEYLDWIEEIIWP